MPKFCGMMIMVLVWGSMLGICFSAPKLGDTIRVLQILIDASNADPAGIDDVDGDNKIGMAEAIYGLEIVTGLRTKDISCGCSSMDDPEGNTVIVSNMTELQNACNAANQDGNMTILIEDGTYQLSNMLYITADDVTFRGKSGNRDSVVLRGNGMDGSVSHVFLVAGKNFTVADLTLGWVFYHGVQVQGEQDADGFLAHNVRFVDTNEQMLKVSGSGDVATGDNGIVECCLFEYTAGIGPQYYVGGVDCHLGKNWIVRNNIFKHIRSPETYLAEHAIHFWNSAENTLVENNIIINCDRGIGFGLGTSPHIGGIIRNNMVHTTRDVGIGLESASNVNVYHNTVYTENYFNSIEYRFTATSGGEIANNLTNQAIASRNGGAAELYSNYTSAAEDFFADPTNGNMHLVAITPGVTDAGADISTVTTDIDCQARPAGMAPDIGADEYY
jgi:hypothetical protein